jgi:hypothetical protein
LPASAGNAADRGAARTRDVADRFALAGIRRS